MLYIVYTHTHVHIIHTHTTQAASARDDEITKDEHITAADAAVVAVERACASDLDWFAMPARFLLRHTLARNTQACVRVHKL